MVDADIRARPQAYPRVNGRPDPNIDFRRVANLVVFFQRRAASLTTRVLPGDPENLREWQGGDIVVFGPPLEHIAVVSDRRGPDGVPYLLHNAGPYASETDALLSWPRPLPTPSASRTSPGIRRGGGAAESLPVWFGRSREVNQVHILLGQRLHQSGGL